MISRRNIRVKVMQTLYNIITLESDIKPGEPQKILQNHFDQTRQLFVHLTYFLTEVARYAETDSHQRAGKHLPSREDLNVNTKIAGNEILWKMLDDPALREQFSTQKPERITDKELIRKIYHALVERPEYKTYITQASRDKAEEKKII